PKSEICNERTKADKFAADLLIPPKEYKMFIQSNSYYQSEIIRFADRLNIDPGIVVGRLQHDRIIEPSWYNSLRKKYEWNSSIFQTNSPLNLQPE
ncbi:MAG: ImmA/IrrE family metallo-endopeptidase, partial [Fidelibacterota bacterium]